LLGCWSMKLVTVLLVCIFVLSSQASVSKFVLVHGAWQNSAPYEKTVDGLKDLGYKVEAVNLPANDFNATDAQRAGVTYKDYIDYMDDVMDDLKEKVILVCHSSGGMLCQIVVGRHENKIEAVVFVNAWILYPDTSQAGVIGPAFDPFIAAAESSDCNCVPNDANFINTILLPTNTQEQRDEFIALTFPQPLPYLNTVFTASQSRDFNKTFDSVERYAIIATDDPSGPYLLLANNLLDEYTLIQVTGGHQFYLFYPDLLVNNLDTIAKSYATSNSNSNDSSNNSSDNSSSSVILLVNLCFIASLLFLTI